MDDDKLSKSVKLPTFDGDQDKFQLWLIRFTAFAAVGNFKKAIGETAESDLPTRESEVETLDPTVDVNKPKLAAAQRNLVAMANLTMAMASEKTMVVVYKALDTDWPSGLAWKVMTALKRKFMPMDMMTAVELRSKMNGITMRRGDDPKELFEQLASIRNRYLAPGQSIPAAEVMAVVLSAAPKEYQGVLLTEQARLGNSVTVDDMERIMTQLYRAGHHDRDSKGGKGKEMALSQICFSCGKEGHKSFQCTSKDQKKRGGGKGKFTGKCNNCGMTGHKNAQCWELESNASKRPSGWKSKKNQGNESANPSVDGGTELLLIAADPVEQRRSYKDALVGEIEDTVAAVDAEIGAPVVDVNRWRGLSNLYAALIEDDDDTNVDETSSPTRQETIAEMWMDNNDDNSLSMTSIDWQGNLDIERQNEDSDSMPSLLWPDDDASEGSDDNKEVENDVLTVVSEASNAEMTLAASDLTFPKTIDLLKDPNVWIGDTGATTHSTPNLKGMSKTREGSSADTVTVGNGQNMVAGIIGHIQGTACDQHGQELYKATLTDVTHVEHGQFNLFSVTRKMKEGWELHGTKERMSLTKNDQKIVFDIAIPTRRGMIFAMYFRRDKSAFGEFGAAGISAEPNKITMSLKEAHAKCGHVNEDATRQVAQALGICITRGTLGVCDACSQAKARQKNVPKTNENHITAARAGERIFLDISSIKPPKIGTTLSNRHWRMMVDEYLGCQFSDFFDTKSGMIEPTCSQFERWKKADKEVKFLRMNNAGENTKLIKRANGADWKLNLHAEYTARNTPQQNHRAELAIADSAARGRALMAAANVPTTYRYKLFREAFKTATLLGNLRVEVRHGKTATRFEHFLGENPKFASHLRTWGEAGTVTLKSIATPKIANKGEQCMMVGYAPNHTGDTYRMWNPSTGRVHTTRDVIWLRRMYFAPTGVNTEVDAGCINTVDVLTIGAGESNLPTGESDDDDGANDNDDVDVDDDVDLSGVIKPPDDENDDSGSESSSDDDDGDALVTTRSGRTIKPTARFIEEMGGMQVTAAVELYYQKLLDNEISCVGAGLGGGFGHTSELHVMKFKQAMASPDKEKWQEAVEAEHENLKSFNVFKPVLRSELKPGTRVITSTWAMKKKANGRYKARINARGYEQVDGQHYHGHNVAAPVANEITIRVVLVLMIMMAYVGELLDVKGAFLHGDFQDDEQIHMEVPEGFHGYYDPKLYVLLLLQTLYGLKNAAREYWNKLLECFRHMEYGRSQVDPCLYHKWIDGFLVIWISWVDDCLFICPAKMRDKIRSEMTTRFDCDIIGNMDEYVGCKIERNENEGWVKITQPVLLQSFEDEFELPTERKEPTTPGEPGQCLMPVGDSEELEPKQQTKYRSGVGKLLHMMRWLRPDILNSVRDLSKYMKRASSRHLQAMKRTMRYCLKTRERGLKLQPRRKWNGDRDFKFRVHGRSDSTYASDQTTMRSVTGTTVFLEGAPVAMKCFQQANVTLSSAEAELMAAVTCAQDMLYVMRLLQSMDLKVKLPMILEVDNRGAVGLANNWSVGRRTRHVDARLHFLRELKEQGLLLTQWLAGEDMSSDLLTKNLPRATHEKHTKVYCGADEYNELQGG